MFEKVFGMLVGLVVGIYVARYLQPTNYGLLNYAISFAGIFAAFSTLGLDSILVREFARRPEDSEWLLGTALVLRGFGTLLLMVLLTTALFFMGNDTFTNLLIYIIASAEIFKSFEVINAFYQSKVLSKNVVKVQLIANLSISLFKILLISLQAPLIWFAIAILIGSILNAIGYVFIYWTREGNPFYWKVKKILAFDLLKESWPLVIYGFMLYVQARIDQVMLGKMLNNYEVGQYSVALKLIEMLGFIPMALMSTFSPSIAKAKINDKAIYEDRLLNLYRLMFLVFLVVAIPVYLFADEMIVFLYGEEYKAAGILLSLFAIRLFFTNMGVGKSVFIVNESLFKYSLITAVVGATVNISINYLLIPKMASVGAIIATIISFSVSIFFVDLFYSKTRHNQKLMFKAIFSFWKLKEGLLHMPKK
jgi:O-antigen/teichoic acid export membrane protein